MSDATAPSTAVTATTIPPGVDSGDLQEPTSIFESIRILRAQDPRYTAITHPSEEQIEDINAIIKNLRLELDNGAANASGDATAFELAVALLWHNDGACINEGIQLMEYLLNERWDQHWSAVVRTSGVPQGSLVESLPDEIPEEKTEEGEEEWVDLAAPHSHSMPRLSASATAASLGVPLGSAVRYATAPPPPEDEGGSVPPSLVRERHSTGENTVAPVDPLVAAAANASSCPPPASLASAAEGDMPVPTACARSTLTWSHSSYTSPGTCSSSAATAGSACSSSDRIAASTAVDASHMRDERLAQCYYHLAVGYLKLRKNDKALFYVNNMLNLSPNNADGLLLRRLLAARLYVRNAITRSIPFLAVGLLFL